MRKFFSKCVSGLALAAALLFGASDSLAIGWPSNYQGVMLQGFQWDSYKGSNDSKWTTLTSRADELSTYFSLIWVPNSAKPASNPSNGYDPVYWFTNHNTCWGKEAEIREMIQTYKAKGTGIIEDVVINHRSGRSNWVNFPKEEWNGQTWEIGLDGICSTDEVNQQSGQPHATGAADTGEDFNGARDLDHTNANVQNNCKNYCKFLLEDMGYAGFRLDMVKGYGGQYTKIYNNYAKPTYCVGEYFDGNYDLCAQWIEATGKTSACFDFPLKFQLNKAFPGPNSYNCNELVWKANGTTDQPAGLIHFGYQQYAVTFVDNHDTYRDHNKFNGNVVAANAFLLFSPGTPCIFWAHYNANKSKIQELINIRNACGIHNQSPVTVLMVNQSCYMAEITGTKGKAVIKIGSTMDSPSGYSASDIKASGDGYCVWTKVGGIEPPHGGDETPSELYVLGNVAGNQWNTASGIKMTKSGKTFTATNLVFEPAAGETRCYFNLATVLGADWDAVNAGNRFGATSEGDPLAVNTPGSMRLYAADVDASGCQSWTVEPGTYNLVADFDKMTITVTDGTGDPITPPDPDMPSSLYIIGEVDGNSWAANTGVQMAKGKGVFTRDVEIVSETGDPRYFSFAISLASDAEDWVTLNMPGNRYAPVADTPLELTKPATFVECDNGDMAKAFCIGAGEYSLVVDWAAQTVTAYEKGKAPGAVDGIELDGDEAPAVYYNLQGVRVANPESGIFIRVKGNKATKVML